MIMIPSTLGLWPNSSDIQLAHISNAHLLFGYKDTNLLFYLISLMIIALRIKVLLVPHLLRTNHESP